MNFHIKNHRLTINTRARRKWNDFKVFSKMNTEGTWHLVWGKISVYLEHLDMEIHPTCAVCGSMEIGEVSRGDEGWTVCQDCGSIEQGYKYVSLREIESK